MLYRPCGEHKSKVFIHFFLVLYILIMYSSTDYTPDPAHVLLFGETFNCILFSGGSIWLRVWRIEQVGVRDSSKESVSLLSPGRTRDQTPCQTAPQSPLPTEASHQPTCPFLRITPSNNALPGSISISNELGNVLYGSLPKS